MRSVRPLRLVAVVLALAASAAACGGDSEDDGAAQDSSIAETTTTLLPTTTRPPVTSLAAPELTTTTASPEDAEITVPPTTTADETRSERPPAPSGLTCLPGTGEGEVLVEWDAPADTSNIVLARLYVSKDGGPMNTARVLSLDEIDTTREGGARWAATVGGLALNVPLQLTVTYFNNPSQDPRYESRWNVIDGVYRGIGQPCNPEGTVTTTTMTTTTTTTTAPPSSTTEQTSTTAPPSS